MVSPAPANSPSVVTVVPSETIAPTEAGSDGFPTFATPLTAANTQMSDQYAAALQSQLTALASARKAGTVSDAEYRRRLKELNDLAEKHGSQAETILGR